jgi:hypothetical protein
VSSTYVTQKTHYPFTNILRVGCHFPQFTPQKSQQDTPYLDLYIKLENILKGSSYNQPLFYTSGQLNTRVSY